MVYSACALSPQPKHDELQSLFLSAEVHFCVVGVEAAQRQMSVFCFCFFFSRHLWYALREVVSESMCKN